MLVIFFAELTGLAEIASHAAFGAGGEQVAQADVGEGAARHHAVVAAARAVAVEVDRLHAVLHQELPGGRVLLDRAGRRDVVGRHAVADHHQHARRLRSI